MARQTFICNPGQSFIEPGTENDMCSCRHVRSEHWFGGGDCGFEFKTGSKCRCQYFKRVLVKAVRDA